ncbi:unnamed protein product [Sympodiomycopsis kandeliae]
MADTTDNSRGGDADTRDSSQNRASQSASTESPLSRTGTGPQSSPRAASTDVQAPASQQQTATGSHDLARGSSDDQDLHDDDRQESALQGSAPSVAALAANVHRSTNSPSGSGSGQQTSTSTSGIATPTSTRRTLGTMHPGSNAPSAIPAPSSSFARGATNASSTNAGSVSTNHSAQRSQISNSPRRNVATPLASTSAARTHTTGHTAPSSSSLHTGDSNENNQRANTFDQPFASRQVANASNTASSAPRAHPPMFGSYSGGPPSLYNIATGGLTGDGGNASSSSNAPANTNTSNTTATTSARVPNAGYWRAPARPSNAQHAASASGSFAFGSANNITARNALGTATAPRPPQHTFAFTGWPTADPAGWAGTTSEIRRGSEFQENSMISFSWTIQDVRLLQEEVEKSPQLSEEGRSISAGAGKSEIWTTSPFFGDGKWRLELVRTRRHTDQTAAHQGGNADLNSPRADLSGGATVLSAFLTSMVLDYNSADVSIPTQLMFGIRLPSTSAPSHNSSKNWIWTHFTTHTFKREAEFFECNELPTISSLLSNPALAQANAFQLVIQIGTGPQLAKMTNGKESAVTATSAATSPSRYPFQMPGSQYVPTSMIDGLEGLIDDAVTGDVALIVRERGVVPVRMTSGEGGDSMDDTGDIGFEVIPWPVGSPMPSVSAHHHHRETSGGVSHSDAGLSDDGAQIVVRDRVIWAHSSILRSRSEYFRTMLDSGFSEGQGLEQESEYASAGGTTSAGSKRVRVLRISDADYPTAQALLRYLYVSDIDYMASEDVRSASLDDQWMTIGEGNHSGSDEHRRSLTMPIWEWRSLAQIETGESQATVDWTSPSMSRNSVHLGSESASAGTGRRHTSVSDHSQSPSHSGYSRPSSMQVDRKTSNSHLPSVGLDESTSPTHSSGTMRSNANASATRMSILRCLATDPHPHPCAPTSAASSLGLYRLAHRYNQTCLTARSKDHLVSVLQPSNAFSILLATHLYPDLYHSVQKYVLENWENVQSTREFERCCDEVSEGEWGLDAGRALRSFMRSLTSPTSRTNSGENARGSRQQHQQQQQQSLAGSRIGLFGTSHSTGVSFASGSNGTGGTGQQAPPISSLYHPSSQGNRIL